MEVSLPHAHASSRPQHQCPPHCIPTTALATNSGPTHGTASSTSSTKARGSSTKTTSVTTTATTASSSLSDTQLQRALFGKGYVTWVVLQVVVVVVVVVGTRSRTRNRTRSRCRIGFRMDRVVPPCPGEKHKWFSDGQGGAPLSRCKKHIFSPRKEHVFHLPYVPFA